MWIPKWLRTSTLDVYHTAKLKVPRRQKVMPAVVGFLLVLFLLVATNMQDSEEVVGGEDISLDLDVDREGNRGREQIVVAPKGGEERIDPMEVNYTLDGMKRKWKPIDDAVEVSIITACRNRLLDLDVSLQTWLRVKGVDEIVIVDWGSSTTTTTSSSFPSPSSKDDNPSSEDVGDYLSVTEQTGQLGKKVVLTRVVDQKDWIMTQAVNLAIQIASGKRILKVKRTNPQSPPIAPINTTCPILTSNCPVPIFDSCPPLLLLRTRTVSPHMV